jgi:hypothetical protein
MNDRTFWARWIAANGVAEAIGLGTTFVLGMAAAPLLEDMHGIGAAIAAAGAAVLLGIFLEGVVVGWMQGAVLRQRRSGIPLRSWVWATAVGAGIAWLIGMIPSTTFALMQDAGSAETVEEPDAALQLLFAAGLGAVTGPILGVAQWRVLRRHMARSARWLWANALAWAVGMPVIFAGMDRVPWDGSALERALALYAVCLIAGLVVGAIHGAILARLTRP